LKQNIVVTFLVLIITLLNILVYYFLDI